jgi:hypothetical protein
VKKYFVARRKKAANSGSHIFSIGQQEKSPTEANAHSN